jgi:hypothetical protein
MCPAPQQFSALGQVVLAVLARPLVRWTQEFDDSDSLATAAVPDFEEGQVLDVLTSGRISRIRRQVVDVDVLFELDEVAGRDLGSPEPEG